MSEKILTVKYQCQHPSCQVFCMKGEFTLGESYLEELKEAYEEADLMKSPRAACRLGFAQPFKIVSVEDADFSDPPEVEDESASSGVVAILKAEHLEVIKRLDIMEEHLRKRDVEALWISSSKLENEIMLHSILKEEGALFPGVTKKLSMGEAYMQIIHEDHKEFISLLSTFRNSLQHDEILNGIVNSLIVNLRNHIRKEEEEFFPLLVDQISDEDMEPILEVMNKMEADYVPTEPGDRSEVLDSPFNKNRKMMDFEIKSVKSSTTVDDWSCH
ncbi:MAG: hemerythrin domain-containing protein [Thermodesulfobacteriota bacterium]